MKFDFGTFLFCAAFFLLVVYLIFMLVCGLCGFFPDDIYVVVVDGEWYYDVRNIKISCDSVSFDTGKGKIPGVEYVLPCTEVEVIEMHKGFFQKEYVEVQP